jgi:hypothetical protein
METLVATSMNDTQALRTLQLFRPSKDLTLTLLLRLILMGNTKQLESASSFCKDYAIRVISVGTFILQDHTIKFIQTRPIQTRPTHTYLNKTRALLKCHQTPVQEFHADFSCVLEVVKTALVHTSTP